MSAIVFFAFVVFLLKRFTNIFASQVNARYVLFFVLWLIQLSSEVLVLASFSSFVAYLQLPIDHCKQANTFNIFSNYMPKSYDGFSFAHIIESSYSNRMRADLSNITFAMAIGIINTGAHYFVQNMRVQNYKATCSSHVLNTSAFFTIAGWDLIPPHYAPAAKDAFQNLCEVRLQECGLDPATLVCSLNRPDNAEFGGTLYQNFLKVVIAAIVLRGVNELASLAVILYSLRCSSLEWWGGTIAFARESCFSPLLRFMLDRDEFFAKIVQAKFNHRELTWRFARSALMIGTQQVVNLYFIVRIAQAGLEATTLLTLLKEWIQTLYLVGRVVFKWFKHWRKSGDSPSDHASPDASSGSGDEGGALKNLPSVSPQLGGASSNQAVGAIQLPEVIATVDMRRLSLAPVSRPSVVSTTTGAASDANFRTSRA